MTAMSNSLVAEQTADPARPNTSPNTSCKGAAAIDQAFDEAAPPEEEEEELGTASVMKTV